MNTAGKLFLLIGFLAGLLSVSCSDNRAVRLRYEVERKYFLADKLTKAAQIRPELNEPGTNVKIRAAYADLVSFCYASLDSVDKRADSIEYREISQLTYHSAIRLAQYLFASRRFDSSSAVVSKLETTIALPPREASGAKVLMGQALQAMGKLDSAVAVYNSAVSLFIPPLEQGGNVFFTVFNVPAHVASVYAQTGDSAKFRRAFTRAESYYRNLATSAPRSRLAMASWAMLARMYGDVRDGRAAVNALEQLTDSTGAINPEARVTISDIQASQLGDFATALRGYDGVLNSLKGRDTIIRPELIFKKAMVVMEQKKYDESRRMLVELQAKYDAYYSSNPMPQFIKARTFELEGNWQRAETEYKYLIDNYPGTDQAFSTYLYLAEQYAKQGRTLESNKLLEKAEQVYTEAAAKGARTGEEALALSYKAELLRRKADFRNSAAVLTQIFDKFPDTEVGRRALLTAAAVYREKLKEPAVADSLVAVFVKTASKVEDSES
jgi:tetratricopeptide (TPR) repeat protein